MASEAMDALATRFASQSIGSIFLYTHEAHPGEQYPPLTSMEQKFRHANALRDVYNVSRSIIVDDLDGACHRAYGSMPNMTWIFNRQGIPVYKSDWTHALSVEHMLNYLIEMGERRKSGERIAPFHVERLEYRTQDSHGFYDGLNRAGQQAVDDFARTFPGSRPSDWEPKDE